MILLNDLECFKSQTHMCQKLTADVKKNFGGVKDVINYLFYASPEIIIDDTVILFSGHGVGHC